MTKAASSPPGDRIAKVLARAGIASRREAERMIEAGRVSVNGAIIDRAALNVTETDKITVDGKPLNAPEPSRLWLYHKNRDRINMRNCVSNSWDDSASALGRAR